MTPDNMKPELRYVENSSSTQIHGGCPGDQRAGCAVSPSLFRLVYIPLRAESA